MNKVVFILLFICSILLGKVSKSQDNFNLRYGTDSIPDIGVTILTVDTGYYVLDISFYNSYKTKLSLSFIDSLGNLQWRKSYGSQGKYFTGGRTGKQLILSPDGSKMYYACSVIDSSNRNFGALWSFNRQGDSLWCKYYGDSLTFYSNSHCQITSDSCVIIAGAMNNGTTQAMLIKTDSLGNKIWEQNYGGGGAEYGCSVLQTTDGGFMMGITTTSFGGDVDIAVIKTNSSGIQQWLLPYTGNYNETSQAYLIALEDGNYALCGGKGSSTMNYGWPRIIKINSFGTVIWDKKYGPLAWDGTLGGIVENKDGTIIGSGSGNSKGVILKVAANGDSLWFRNFNHPTIINNFSDNYLWAIDTAIIGGYVCAGVMYPSPPDTGSADVWVIKVDEWGCDTLGCQFVSVEENEMEKAIINIYPNPTSDYLFVEIETELFESGSLTFSIYDIIGKKLLSIQARSQWESLDVSKLSSGTYILSIEKNGEIIGKSKFIKE